jgi:hypothetical protein
LLNVTLNELNGKLTVQSAVVLSKMARMGWPQQDPTLIEDLLHRIVNAGDDDGAGRLLMAERAMQILLQTIKALASRSLPAQRRQFQELSRQLLPVLIGLLSTHTSALPVPGEGIIGSDDFCSDYLTSTRLALLTLKTIRYALCHGHAHLDGSLCNPLLQLMHERISTRYFPIVAEITPALSAEFQLARLKLLLQVGKLLGQLEQSDQLAGDLCRLPVYTEQILPWYMAQLATANGQQIQDLLDAVCGRFQLDRFYLQSMNLLREFILIPNSGTLLFIAALIIWRSK